MFLEHAASVTTGNLFDICFVVFPYMGVSAAVALPHGGKMQGLCLLPSSPVVMCLVFCPSRSVSHRASVHVPAYRVHRFYLRVTDAWQCPCQVAAAWASQPVGSSLSRPADGSGSGDVRLRVAALEAALAASHAETKRLTVKNEELVIARDAMLHDMQVCTHHKFRCASAKFMLVDDADLTKLTQ